ncbi:hypothetical protein PHLGIDRAFT_102260 [Phlebiopsis gigantea 11061_1 CR5-6]|uniref:Uncharacterized protein n=1 Tax=Phlebiopsis gigantea (strain 11061_1 CR5-6) TaxID=745531 RepID=A0A0C3NWF0_PHLG1|nr:hypothetical protein PHLGIDRAFT_102260 [Phlebiopsis gigantea 11061_1 CR5-6]
MFSSRLTLSAVAAALATSVVADLKVLSPGGDNLWWVANSINTLSWTCHESPFSNFTVLVANTNANILSQAQAIIAIENNFDCSKTITQQQEIFPAATGYTIQLANTLNNTDVYAESAQFEIKPQGSAYPDASATPTDSGASATGSSSGASGSGSATGSGSGAAAQTSSPSSGASGLQGSLAGVLAAAAGVLSLMV